MCLQFADQYRSETKKIILVKNVIQQTSQCLRFVSGRYQSTNCIQDAPIVYFIARWTKVNYERKAWQELLECLLHCNTGTLRQQSCLYPVPYRRQTVTLKRKGLQEEHWAESLQCTVKKTFESKRKETFQILYKFLNTFVLFLTQGVWRQKIKKIELLFMCNRSFCLSYLWPKNCFVLF